MLANKNNKKDQGQKIEMAPLVQENSNTNDKTVGNPNTTIEKVASKIQTPSTPTFEQQIDIKDIDAAIMENLKNLSSTCYNFSVKYSEVSGDFKKVGDAVISYANVLNQKINYENTQKQLKLENKNKEK